MSKIIDYYFTPVSPWTYLGGIGLARLAGTYDVEIRVKPVDYSVIFPASGGLPLGKRAPQRQAYRKMELERWRAHYQVPLVIDPAFFPVPDQLAARMILAVDKAGGDSLRYAQAVLRAVWEEERDVSDQETLTAIAREQGEDPAALLDYAQSQDSQDRWQDLTKEALDLGVFGAPTYLLDGELFWGQDRLDFLEKKLAGS
ncbi:2-hydroxychromene-2-carboxylate isomerase [Rhodovibrionaceae bacterium A322]